MKQAQAAPMGREYRVSNDSAWPLRDSEGRTWVERKRIKESEKAAA